MIDDIFQHETCGDVEMLRSTAAAGELHFASIRGIKTVG